MTASARIKIAILAMLAALVVTVGPAWIGYQVAYSGPSIAAIHGGHPYRDSLYAMADAGSAAAVSDATPADQLHDPIAAPAATIDDLKQAKRQGWAVLAFAIGVIVAKLLGRAKSISWLAALSKGRTAVIVGAASALVVATYNALADGGSLFAGLYAGAVAVAAWWQSHPGDAA